MTVLELREVSKSYRLRGFLRQGPELQVLAGVSLSLKRHEILGLVGESGCGKSTLARLPWPWKNPIGASFSSWAAPTGDFPVGNAGASDPAYRPCSRTPRPRSTPA